MSGDTETAEEFKARYQAKQEWLHEKGFDRTIITIGGDQVLSFLGGGPREAAMCLTCFSLVPIADLTDGTTSIDSHAEWHEQ